MIQFQGRHDKITLAGKYKLHYILFQLLPGRLEFPNYITVSKSYE